MLEGWCLMGKAIVGALLLGAAVLDGLAMFVLASTGVGIVALPFLGELMGALVLGAASSEAAAIADTLSPGQRLNIASRAPAAAWQIVYGQQRVGGTIIFYSTTGGNKDYLNLVIVWAKHQIESIDALYFDGRKVYFDGALGTNWGNADSNNHVDDAGNTYNFGGHVYVEHRYGYPGQLVRDNSGTLAPTNWISGLTTNDSLWTSRCTADGCAYSYIKLTFSTKLFPSGQPGIRCTLKGKNDIYDPRTATRGYSYNWALCVNDFICQPDYGFRCDYATEIDHAQLVSAANISDEAVPLAYGDGLQTEPRYTVNGMFTTDSSPGDLLQSMLNAGAGRVSYVGGTWKIFPGAWISPTLSFDEGDLVDHVKWKPKVQQRDKVNAVKGTFVCPVYPYQYFGNFFNGDFYSGTFQTDIFNGQWQPTDYPAYYLNPARGYAQDTYFIEDLNTRYWLDLKHQFCISVATAQRIAKITLLRGRQQGTTTLTMKMNAYQARPMDVIMMSMSKLSWVNKYFEVQSFKLNVKLSEDATKAEPAQLSVSLEVQETDSSVYAWSTNDEMDVRNNPSPTINYSGTVLPPTNLVLTSGSSTAIISPDGIVRPRIRLDWTPPNDLTASSVDVQYQLTGWTLAWDAVPSVPVSQTYTFVPDVVSGQNYDVRIRSSKANGSISDWVTVGPLTVSTVLSTFDSLPVAPAGTLVGSAYSDGTAHINVSPFTATVGSLTANCLSGVVSLVGLNKSQLYHVYYVDPNFAGGSITPIATQNTSDYTNKMGYYLIGSLVTPSYSSGGSRFLPSAFYDVGSQTTTTPTAAFDGDVTTDAVVSAFCTVGSGAASTVGQCIWAGFPSVTTSAVTTLTVIAAIVTSQITCKITANVAGAPTATIVSSAVSSSTTTYTLSIPSGTNLGSISVTATVDGSTASAAPTGTYQGKIEGFEMWIQ
jgi:hypothetical protein